MANCAGQQYHQQMAHLGSLVQAAVAGMKLGALVLLLWMRREWQSLKECFTALHAEAAANRAAEMSFPLIGLVLAYT